MRDLLPKQDTEAAIRAAIKRGITKRKMPKVYKMSGELMTLDEWLEFANHTVEDE
jgi:hypothetical protein